MMVTGRRNRARIVRLAAVAALVLLLPTLCEACPTCKDGVSDGANHENVIRGYFWSIVFMMASPFLIFGSLATYFYIQIRKSRVELDQPLRGPVS